jgi:hypothetical protein
MLTDLLALQTEDVEPERAFLIASIRSRLEAASPYGVTRGFSGAVCGRRGSQR